ncbi:MAG: pilus assembly protein TadG-related protein [Pseudomonadota bacterium]
MDIALTLISSTLSRWIKDKSGNIVISFAITLIPFIAAAGMALDYARGVVVRTKLQSSLDASALAAASLQNASNSERLKKALIVFYANHSKPALTPRMTVSFGEDEVRVNATVHLKNAFMKALGRPTTRVVASATAGYGTVSGPCVLTLNERSKEALMLNSDSRIESPNCTVQVNSTHRSALFANSKSGINADTICVAGDWDTNGGSSFSPRPEDCPAVKDPLAHLPKPPEANGSCDWYDRTVKGRTRLRPGVYCKKLELDSGARVTFEPGIYIMRDGEFIVNSGSRATGHDMMMYLEGSNNARFNINSDSHIEFRGRTSGPYAGLVFFQERGSRADYSILNSDSSSIIEGVIYLPSTPLHLNSKGRISSASPWTAVIVNELELNSDSVMNINTDYASSSVPVPAGIGPGDGTGAAVLLKH